MYAVFQNKNKEEKPVTLKTLEDSLKEEGNLIFDKSLLENTTTKPFYQQISEQQQKASWRKRK